MFKSLLSIEKDFNMREVDKATPNWLKVLMVMFVILIIASVIFIDRANAADTDSVYLVVMSVTNTGTTRFTYVYHPVADMQQCFQLIENSRVDITQGGDGEGAIAMYCTPSKGRIRTLKEMTK